jgi:hypothetical protein
VSRAEVLEAMQTERANLESLLTTLSDEQMCLPMLEGERSIKDILAHIADWELRCASWIETGLRGETPARPETGYTWDDIDGLNERTFIENQNRPLPEVLAISHQAYQQLLAQVRSLSEEDITNPNRFPWTENEPLATSIAANSYWHYHEHAEQIQASLEDMKGQG